MFLVETYQSVTEKEYAKRLMDFLVAKGHHGNAPFVLEDQLLFEHGHEEAVAG